MVVSAHNEKQSLVKDPEHVKLAFFIIRYRASLSLTKRPYPHDSLVVAVTFLKGKTIYERLSRGEEGDLNI